MPDTISIINRSEVSLLLPCYENQVKVCQVKGTASGEVLAEMREHLIRTRKTRLYSELNGTNHYVVKDPINRKQTSYATKIVKDDITNFFRENNQLDYTISEVARTLHYRYNSLKYHIQQMVVKGEIVVIRDMGNGCTYQLREWRDTKVIEEVKRISVGL